MESIKKSNLARWNHFGRKKRKVAEVLYDYLIDDVTGLLLDYIHEFIIAVAQTRSILLLDDDFTVIGRIGKKKQFRQVSGLAFDCHLRIFAADFWQNRIQVLNLKGDLLLVFGEGVLVGPHQVAVNPGGTLVAVANSKLNRISFFDLTGNLIIESDSLFSNPRGVGWLSDDEVVICDCWQRQVVTMDLNSLQLKRTITRFSGGFTVAIANSKLIVISDPCTNEVQVIALTGDNSQSTRLARLSEPQGVAVDRFGVVYVAEKSRVLAIKVGALQWEQQLTFEDHQQGDGSALALIEL